ncbi:MAG: sporulation protein YunB [Clostridia bacterium]|nr:sporulation protein YunB [Clostridia bacterium]
MAKYKTITAISFRKRKRIAKILLVFFLIVLLLYLYISKLATPLLVETTQAQVKVYANKAMNIAITEAMNQNITYDDLVNVTTDSSGKISLIQANSIQINALSKLIGRVTISSLNELVKVPIKIPLGAFSGIPLLAGVGPKIPLNVYPYGDVSCRFESKFISAGINQTQHKIYLYVSCNINVIIPFSSLKVLTNSEVLICESVILGEIPDTFLKSGELTEMFSLVN